MSTLFADAPYKSGTTVCWSTTDSLEIPSHTTSIERSQGAFIERVLVILEVNGQALQPRRVFLEDKDGDSLRLPDVVASLHGGDLIVGDLVSAGPELAGHVDPNRRAGREAVFGHIAPGCVVGPLREDDQVLPVEPVIADQVRDPSPPAPPSGWQ